MTRYTTADGLSDNEVRTIQADREGGLWVGTNVGGLNRWRRSNVTAYTAAQGLSDRGVFPVCEDQEGRMWIGTLGDGLYSFEGGKFTPHPLPGPSFAGISSLRADREGGLWVGNFNGGLGRLKGGRFARFAEGQGWVPAVPLAIYQDAGGDIWVGTLTRGLIRFRDGSFTAYRASDGLLNDHVATITQTRDGALWLGTPDGVSRLKDGRFTNYRGVAGLLLVRSIHEDAGGALWIGTYGYGLTRFKAGEFARVTAKDGLFDDVVSRIIEDDQGQFWMSGNRGIYRASRRELNDFADGKLRTVSCVSYGVADGMETAETNGGGQPSGWRARDGRLWFPMIKGVVAIDPRVVDRQAPPVVIEGATLDGETLPTAGSVEVGAGREDLEIHYTGLSLSRPGQVKFRYRLEGLEGEWVEAGTRRTAYYSRLPAGEYTFRVIAANGDGVWNTEGATLRVGVIPHFWQTWWFFALALAAAGGLVWLAVRRRISRMQQRHAEREPFSRRLIDSQEAERKRIAAELHDSLGQSLVIIKNRARLSLRQPGDRQDLLGQLDGIAAVASQALVEVKEIAFNLRPHLLDRLGLTETLESMLDKVFSSDELSVEVEIDPIDDVFSKESEIFLYRIVQESANNIVKHARASAAEVVIKRDEGQLVVTIRDNGRGFDPAAAAGSDAQANRSFGLIGMAERARLLGGRYEIESAVGRGTTVTVSFGLKGGRHER